MTGHRWSLNRGASQPVSCPRLIVPAEYEQLWRFVKEAHDEIDHEYQHSTVSPPRASFPFGGQMYGPLRWVIEGAPRVTALLEANGMLDEVQP